MERDCRALLKSARYKARALDILREEELLLRIVLPSNNGRNSVRERVSKSQLRNAIYGHVCVCGRGKKGSFSKRVIYGLEKGQSVNKDALYGRERRRRQ